MTSEQKKEADCSVCGGRLKATRIVYTQVIGDKIYIIEEVPAEVCEQCGEEYLSPDTVDAIQAAIEETEPIKKVLVPVYQLQPSLKS
jgi:YgiT-type zinc finger domain-containing protein